MPTLVWVLVLLLSLPLVARAQETYDLPPLNASISQVETIKLAYTVECQKHVAEQTPLPAGCVATATVCDCTAATQADRTNYLVTVLADWFKTTNTGFLDQRALNYPAAYRSGTKAKRDAMDAAAGFPPLP